MIKFKYQHEAICDRCDKSISINQVTRIKFLNDVREYGWSIGKMVLCPECRKKEPIEEEQQIDQLSLFDLVIEDKGATNI